MPRVRAQGGDTLKRNSLAILALCACAALLGGVAAAEDPPPRYAFVNGLWFDGHRFVARTMYSARGELLASSPGGVDSTVDLSGGYLVPPYGEAHNHNAGLIGPNSAAATVRYLREGIFYVKNPGNLPGDRASPPVVNVRSSIDVAYSNGLLTAPDGHPLGLVRRNIARGVMTETDGEGAFYFTIATLADLDRKWPAILAGRPDFIKTALLFSEEYERRRADTTYFAWKGLDPRLLPAIVGKAHQAGLRVSTHIETAADFRAAVAAGADEINHLPGFRPERDDLSGYRKIDRYRITDADAERAAKKKIVVVTTVSEALEALDADTSAADRALVRNARAMIVHNLATLNRHGVPIALGSDRFRSTSTAEVTALLKLGIFDPLTVLAMWSEATPATIFPKRRIGRLSDGYEASFLVLEGDPLADPKNLQRIRMRVKQGLILPEP